MPQSLVVVLGVLTISLLTEAITFSSDTRSQSTLPCHTSFVPCGGFGSATC